MAGKYFRHCIIGKIKDDWIIDNMSKKVGFEWYSSHYLVQTKKLYNFQKNGRCFVILLSNIGPKGLYAHVHELQKSF